MNVLSVETVLDVELFVCIQLRDRAADFILHGILQTVRFLPPDRSGFPGLLRGFNRGHAVRYRFLDPAF